MFKMFKFILLSALVTCVLATDYPDLVAETVEQTADVRADGFERNLVINSGIVDKAVGFADGSIAGSYEYRAPGLQIIKVSYIADENGYQPTSDILPTPPPIPDYILRAIEYIKAHPQAEDKKH